MIQKMPPAWLVLGTSQTRAANDAILRPLKPERQHTNSQPGEHLAAAKPLSGLRRQRAAGTGFRLALRTGDERKEARKPDLAVSHLGRTKWPQGAVGNTISYSCAHSVPHQAFLLTRAGLGRVGEGN